MVSKNRMSKQQRLEELEQQIDEIRKSLPAHSIPTAMLLNLEELEEELEKLQGANEGDNNAAD